MKKFIAIIIGSLIYGIILYSIIKLIPYSNNIKALLCIIITILFICILKILDNNLEK